MNDECDDDNKNAGIIRGHKAGPEQDYAAGDLPNDELISATEAHAAMNLVR